MTIYKEFTFDAAHFLPNVPEGHKCRQLHGHTYSLKVFVTGQLTPPEQWIIDFGDLKAIVNPIIDQLDHKFLNEIPGLENPTAEMLTCWIWQQLKPAVTGLKRIELQETPTSGVTYEE